MICQSCPFSQDRNLGGNRLVCANETSDSYGKVVRAHWESTDDCGDLTELELCGNCKFAEDRNGALVCSNTSCFNSGYAVSSNKPGCFYHQPKNQEKLKPTCYDLPDSFYREQEVISRDHAADYAMNGNHW